MIQFRDMRLLQLNDLSMQKDQQSVSMNMEQFRF